MVSKDYYKTLGLEKNATKEDIKRAFKKLAMKYHPDRAPDDKKKEYEEKFKEINEAVSVLSDDKKRQNYDQFGSEAVNQGMGGSGGFEGFDFSDVMSQFRSGSFGDFDDIFDQIFGGGSNERRRGVRTHKGQDLLYEIEISLEDAVKGTKTDLALDRTANCPKCKGKGANKFENCHHCQGSGYMKRTQRTPFGLFQQTGPCPYCNGRGELPQDSCNNCGGDGLIKENKKIEVTIPKGIEDGMQLRIPHEGEAGAHGGQNGDLYLHVRIKEHEHFQREGNNLNIIVPISFTQAVLGDEIDVPTIDGNAKLKIPAGTQSETVFRMKGKGVPYLKSIGNGDQMVKIKIKVPTKLTKKQRELLEEFKEEKPKGFWDKMWG